MRLPKGHFVDLALPDDTLGELRAYGIENGNGKLHVVLINVQDPAAADATDDTVTIKLPRGIHTARATTLVSSAPGGLSSVDSRRHHPRRRQDDPLGNRGPDTAEHTGARRRPAHRPSPWPRAARRSSASPAERAGCTALPDRPHFLPTARCGDATSRGAAPGPGGRGAVPSCGQPVAAVRRSLVTSREPKRAEDTADDRRPAAVPGGATRIRNCARNR